MSSIMCGPYLEPEPVRVPLRVQRAPADVRLLRDAAQPDLHERVGGVVGAVHDGQVPARQHAHLHLARHGGRPSGSPLLRVDHGLIWGHR